MAAADVQGRFDERVRRSREAILAATFSLLSEEGLGGVSVDAVAKRSGVAKTTIYRHWPTRTALLLEACSKLSARPPAPNTGSLEKDLLRLAEIVAERLANGRWSSVLPSVIDAAERDPDLAAVHKSLHADMMSGFDAAIISAQARGELPARFASSELIGSIVGPLFYRRWFSREPLTAAVARRIVERALSALRP